VYHPNAGDSGALILKRPRATGRPAVTLEEWAAIRQVVFRRARRRCQACGRGGALEVHHVVKRA
jgi:5-methylcytosine-specific restriction endonuclease McrA